MGSWTLKRTPIRALSFLLAAVMALESTPFLVDAPNDDDERNHRGPSLGANSALAQSLLPTPTPTPNLGIALHNSIAFDGLTGYAETPDHPDLDPPGDWTVEAWFKDENPKGFDHPRARIHELQGGRQPNPRKRPRDDRDFGLE